MKGKGKGKREGKGQGGERGEKEGERILEGEKETEGEEGRGKIAAGNTQGSIRQNHNATCTDHTPGNVAQDEKTAGLPCTDLHDECKSM